MNCLITPQLRRTSEIPFHSDRAPGERFVFVGRVLDPVCHLYVVGRKVMEIPADQPEWLDDHRHNCPMFYVLSPGALSRRPIVRIMPAPRASRGASHRTALA